MKEGGPSYSSLFHGRLFRFQFNNYHRAEEIPLKKMEGGISEKKSPFYFVGNSFGIGPLRNRQQG
jgi:hypothetical protein